MIFTTNCSNDTYKSNQYFGKKFGLCGCAVLKFQIMYYNSQFIELHFSFCCKSSWSHIVSNVLLRNFHSKSGPIIASDFHWCLYTLLNRCLFEISSILKSKKWNKKWNKQKSNSANIRTNNDEIAYLECSNLS